MSCNAENSKIGGKRFHFLEVIKALNYAKEAPSIEMEPSFFAEYLGVTNQQARKYFEEEIWGVNIEDEISATDINATDLDLAQILADILNGKGFITKSVNYLSDAAMFKLKQLKKRVLDSDAVFDERDMLSLINEANFYIKQGLVEKGFQFLSKQAKKKITDGGNNSVSRAIHVLASVNMAHDDFADLGARVNEALYRFLKPTEKPDEDSKFIRKIADRVVAKVKGNYEIGRKIDQTEAYADIIAEATSELHIDSDGMALSTEKKLADDFNNFTFDDIRDNLTPLEITRLSLEAERAIANGGMMSSKLLELIQLVNSSKADKDYLNDPRLERELNRMFAKYFATKKDIEFTDPVALMEAIVSDWIATHPGTPITMEIAYKHFYRMSDTSVRRKMIGLNTQWNYLIGKDNNFLNEMETSKFTDSLGGFGLFRGFKWSLIFNNLDQIFTAVFGSPRLGSIALKKMGMDRLFNLEEQSTVPVKEFTEGLLNLMNAKGDNGKNMLDPENTLSIHALRLLRRGYKDAKTPIGFNERKRVIIEDLQKRIDTNRKDQEHVKKYAKALLKIYRQAKTEEELYSKTDEAVIDVVTYMEEGFHKAVDFAVNNTVGSSRPLDIKKFRDIKLRVIPIDDTKKRVVNRNQTGDLATLPLFQLLESNDYYTAEDYFIDRTNKLDEDRIVDVNFIPDVIQQINMLYIEGYTRNQSDYILGVLESDAFKAKQDKTGVKLLKITINRYLDTMLGRNYTPSHESPFEKSIFKPLGNLLFDLATIGHGIALINPVQGPKQQFPLSVRNAARNLQIPRIDIALDVWLKQEDSKYYQYVNKYAPHIAQRGAEDLGGSFREGSIEALLLEAIEDSKMTDNLIERYTIGLPAHLRKQIRNSAKNAEKGLQNAVINSDRGEYIESWLQLLKSEQPGFDINEAVNNNIAPDPDAASRATSRLAQQQGSTIRSRGSGYDLDQSFAGFIARTTVFAWQRFAIMMKRDIRNHMRTAVSPISSKADKAKALGELSSIIVSQILFNKIGKMFNEYMWKYTLIGLGEDEDEVDEFLEDRNTNYSKWMYSNLLRDFTTIPLGDFFTPMVAIELLNLIGVDGKEYLKGDSLEELLTLAKGPIANSANLGMGSVDAIANIRGFAVTESKYQGRRVQEVYDEQDLTILKAIGLVKLITLRNPRFAPLLKATKVPEQRIYKRAKAESKWLGPDAKTGKRPINKPKKSKIKPKLKK